MENFCNVSSQYQKELKAPQLLSFEKLLNQTCVWLDEIEVLEDIFQRQVYKVIEWELKLLNAKIFADTSKQMIIEAGRKLDEIDKELSISSFNLDIQELFLQTIEKHSPKLIPANVDHQRFSIYQNMLELICVFDCNKDTMDSFFEEYKEYLQAYRNKFVMTSILDCYNKILQNIASHLDNLESVEKSNERQIHGQIQRMHFG